MPRPQHRLYATWVFGSLLFLFFVCVFVFAPKELPEYKQRMLAISCALLSGLLAFFLTGTIGLEVKWIKSRLGDIGVKATGGIAVFVLVLWWWMSPLAPIGVEEIKQGLKELKGDTAKIVRLLEGEFNRQLGAKDTQITFLQGQIERLQKVEEPSPRARELAAQIPSNADPYALALKAIAEKRFDDARRLLAEAQETKEVELSRIYGARGLTEIFAVHYADAISWYQKALALRPDDASLLNQTALAFYYAGKYAEAEPLYLRSIEIFEKTLGKEHPYVATSLNNLAELYYAQGKYAEAEPLFRRSLEIWEKTLGKEHPDVALSLNNLAVLYYVQGKYAEAEPLYRRSHDIWEKALGEEHPDVAASLGNLAELYRAQGKYAEAEPLLRRSLEICEKALGKEHPGVAGSLNNLAGLYYGQGKYAEAEPLCQLSLDIREKALGKEHPDVAASLNNLAGLYYAQGKYAEAEPLFRRSLEIQEKALGKEHPDVANSLYNLAELYRAQDKYAEAEPLYLRSLEILEKALGKEHPNAITVRENYTALLKAKKNKESDVSQ